MPPSAMAIASPTATADTALADFLRQQLAQQPHAIMRHHWQGQSLWVKRAGVAHAAWRYHLLAVVAKGLGLPLLQPVPNRGGVAAIATEVQRLRSLAALGLRVPEVLAVERNGFVMRDLGAPGQDTPSLGNAMELACAHGASAVLALWQQGLQAIAQVHQVGACLSQAFARNLVLCPDGMVGFIDFEDDPAAHLPLHLCQVRDALCYAHSTAWILAQADALEPGRSLWQQWQSQRSEAVQQCLAQAVTRLHGLRRLPQDRRWGRDVLRLRQAWALLHNTAEGINTNQ